MRCVPEIASEFEARLEGNESPGDILARRKSLGNGQSQHAFADVGDGDPGHQSGATALATIAGAAHAEARELAQRRGDEGQIGVT